MDYSKEQLARIWLQCAPMGAWNRLDKLKEKMGNALDIWEQFSPALYSYLGENNYSVLSDLRTTMCSRILQLLETCQAYAVFRGSKEYPYLLSTIENPPDVLFVRGILPDENTKTVGIVGSRNNTRYGSSQARKIAKGLAEKSVAIISGLARGIDSMAHIGALDAQGKTIAVLGCGITQNYPPENKDLAKQILETGGCILSELAPDAPPLPYHFPVRNRIISGLSQALLLIEAQEKSGTHSTVNYALNQGREIFALPGNVDSPGSELPLKLLKEGANICTCAEDIMDTMGWNPSGSIHQISLFSDEIPEKEGDPILRCLQMEEKTLEELIEETGLSAGELSTQLTILELGGFVERRAGRAYARVYKN